MRIVREALKTDPSILREAIVALQADNARVEAAAASATIARQHDALFDPRDPSAGNPRGAVVIAEFLDPQCPYCRRLAPQMTHFLANAHDVRLIYKDLPILGPASDLGSRALLAAQRQNAYERMRDAIMRDPQEITLESIRETAEKVGLNWQQLQRDMRDQTIAHRIARNQRLAKALGIDGTPTFVMAGRLIPGADMAQIVDAVGAIRRGRAPNEAKMAAPKSIISTQ